jgi:hypothetical protein
MPSGKRAKKLKAQARETARDGSVATSTEYKRLKKSLNNPSYGRRTLPDGISALYGESNDLPGEAFLKRLSRQTNKKLGRKNRREEIRPTPQEEKPPTNLDEALLNG